MDCLNEKSPSTSLSNWIKRIDIDIVHSSIILEMHKHLETNARAFRNQSRIRNDQCMSTCYMHQHNCSLSDFLNSAWALGICAWFCTSIIINFAFFHWLEMSFLARYQLKRYKTKMLFLVVLITSPSAFSLILRDTYEYWRTYLQIVLSSI